MLAKIAQFNFLPQGGHFHTIKMDYLLFLYAMLTLTEFNLPNFFLNSMIISREQIAFPCLLTEVFTFYSIDLENETPSLGKESFRLATNNRMFLSRHNFNKIMNDESESEEDDSLKSGHHGKVPGGKKKKVNLEEEEALM